VPVKLPAMSELDEYVLITRRHNITDPSMRQLTQAMRPLAVSVSFNEAKTKKINMCVQLGLHSY